VFASGDTLAGGNVRRPRTYSLGIIIDQLNSLVFTRMEATSLAHVLKRIGVRVLMFGLHPVGETRK
jgi:hypothetical protein